MTAKRCVFAEVEAVAGPECVLATSTFSLSVSDMASGMAHPERVVGFHLFNPVAVLPLVEVVRLTLIEPSLAIQPWYANSPNDPNLQYETFMTSELMPWVKANLPTTGTEQNWLLGFSRSGIGGQDLLLKHPDVLTLAATWDFPADMSIYDQYGTSSAGSYGTDAKLPGQLPSFGSLRCRA